MLDARLEAALSRLISRSSVSDGRGDTRGASADADERRDESSAPPCVRQWAGMGEGGPLLRMTLARSGLEATSADPRGERWSSEARDALDAACVSCVMVVRGGGKVKLLS